MKKKINKEKFTKWDEKLHKAYWNNPLIPLGTTSGQLEAIKKLIKEIAVESFKMGANFN